MITAIFITPVIACFLFVLSVWFGFWGPIPGSDELSGIENHQASQLLSADGSLLGTYYLQNRTELGLDEINPVMIDALVAVEDARFYNHNGIDYRALARVFFKTILLGRDTGGGSTITQQLAKNLYPREGTGWVHLIADKFREMIIACRLEQVYDKEKILELYLNSVSFGEEVFGIEMASKRFFNKKASQLNTQEAATLAGMLKATTWYNPKNHPERARERRNVVLAQMVTFGNLDAEQADSLMKTPLETDYTLLTSNAGPAPYFREHIRQKMVGILSSKSSLDGKQYNLYTDGLVIHSTIDSRVQHAAETAVADQMKSLQVILNRQVERNPIFRKTNDPDIVHQWRQSAHYRKLKEEGFSESEIDSVLHIKQTRTLFSWDGMKEMEVSPYDSLRHYLSFLHSGFLAMNPQNGEVLAWVGGISFKNFKYDHVQSTRQAGSAFKPVVYASAIESGRRPCEYERNILTQYEEYEEWTPRNHSDKYGGRYSLQAALAHSYNTIAVDLLMDTGIHQVQQTARKLGIQSNIPAEPSIALGTAEVSLLELVTAYSAFLNGGSPSIPQTITKIFNDHGELIYDFTQSDSDGQKSTRENAISPRTAATMVKMLEKAVNEGTGYPLRSRFGIQHALAGKTGTTQNYTDGWFIGLTPNMVFGSWVGGFNNRVRFDGNMGYASQTALPTAGRFLQNLNSYPELRPPDRFPDQQTVRSYRLNCPDFRPDRLTDRLRDFFRGRDEDEPRVEGAEDEKKSVFGRLKSLFSRNKKDDGNEGSQD